MSLNRRTPLRRVSAKRAGWNTKYAKALREAKQKQIEERGTTYCERCDRNGMVQGHHPGGRINERILVFRLVDNECHHFIHFVNPKQARAEGWLV